MTRLPSRLAFLPPAIAGRTCFHDRQRLRRIASARTGPDTSGPVDSQIRGASSR
ncbi:Hypothetical protein I596_1585 [Dokdonella koreensis DS-123]|uniref:Uncharacterized protein n=1 Tax=Dokdonella koreensis DS-123 TaxID=1300342 RepID=A0A160DTD2_9GAMM|nr:Hypothetical protein I596_1585 [Dokdonella koreensis DS-123]